MKEYTHPEKNNADHVAEPVVEYETDTLIDEEDIAPFLRDKTVEELVQELIESRESWLRGERTYSTEELRNRRPEWRR